MATLSLQIDACQVLGVSPNATLQEIRDAYRTQAKRYHPDAGGEEWAFRLLAQAYEVLSTERVRRANAQEAEANAARASARVRTPYQAPSPPPHGHGQPHQPRPSYTPPPPRGTRPPNEIAGNETILKGLQAAFATVAGPEGGDTPRSAVVDGRFSGWLSFSDGDQANATCDRLRDELHKAGLSVKQWTRELLIPRTR